MTTITAIKRYIVFAGRDEHPEQGWYDYMDSFETPEEAHDSLNLNLAGYDWWQILDQKKGDLQIGRFNKEDNEKRDSA